MAGVIILTVLGLIIISALITSIAAYNNLIKKKNGYENAFSQIDVQLQRRSDLIPNLVDSTKGYMNHEKETLQAVIEARNGVNSAVKDAKSNLNNPEYMNNLSQSEQKLTGALGKLMLVVERYPDLKADRTVQLLMEELSSTENKVSFARQSFNDSVLRYNNTCETFPTLLLARFFGFSKATFFKLPEGTSYSVPKVVFS